MEGNRRDLSAALRFGRDDGCLYGERNRSAFGSGPDDGSSVEEERCVGTSLRSVVEDEMRGFLGFASE